MYIFLLKTAFRQCRRLADSQREAIVIVDGVPTAGEKPLSLWTACRQPARSHCHCGRLADSQREAIVIVDGLPTAGEKTFDIVDGLPTAGEKTFDIVDGFRQPAEIEWYKQNHSLDHVIFYILKSKKARVNAPYYDAHNKGI